MINRKAAKADIDRIKKLDQTARSLGHDSTYYSITRLTSIKSLCKEPEVAVLFCMHLATLTVKQVMKMRRPEYHEPKKWKEQKELMQIALTAMETWLHKKTSKNEKVLWELHRELEKVNGDYENQEWGPVRIIRNSYVLLLEYAMNAMLRPSDAGFWSYQTARQYAERYESSYGTGLIPQSAPLLKDIIDFWCNFYSIEL